jgi:transcription antitermination factor NusG
MKTATELNTLKSPLYGTDDSEACSFCWFAARTQMNCERKVEQEFKGIAKETYLPTQEEIHIWSDRRKLVQRVVIPMILFVKMDSEAAKKVHHTSHFYGFIGKDRKSNIPAPIPDCDIERLQFMLKYSDSPVYVESMPVNLGDKVRIIRGKLQGLEGTVLSIKEHISEIVINLNTLGCAKVHIPRTDILYLQR